MIIKVELLVEVDDEYMKKYYKDDPRNWPQIVIDEITNMENCSFNVIMGEAEEPK